MFDSKPQIITARLSQIVTDPDVNREPDRPWINRLVKEWKVTDIGVPVVAQYQDKFIVLDGQHRLEAMREMTPPTEDPRVQVLCHYGLTKPQMAGMFIALNTNRPVTPFEKFKKAVFAGEPVPMAINAILKRNGLKLSQTGSSGSVACVTQLQSAFNRDKVGGHLESALEVILEAWGPESGNLKGPVVGGIALLFHKHGGQLNKKRLISVMQRHRGGANGLLNNGRKFVDVHGGNLAGGVAESLLIAYNKGRGGLKSVA